MIKLANIIVFVLVVSGCFDVKIAISQSCACPMKDGFFKEFNSSRPHHNPDESATIISTQSDTIRSVLTGRILKIFPDSGNGLTVAVRLNDTTIISYRYVSKFFFKENDSLRAGLALGLASQKNGKYEVGFTYKEKSKSINPMLLLKCRIR